MTTTPADRAGHSLPTQRALDILRRHGPMLALEFADMMWPNSPGRLKVKRVTWYGSAQGVGMHRAAAGFLGKLKVRGLVVAIYGHGNTRWKVKP